MLDSLLADVIAEWGKHSQFVDLSEQYLKLTNNAMIRNDIEMNSEITWATKEVEDHVIYKYQERRERQPRGLILMSPEN